MEVSLEPISSWWSDNRPGLQTTTFGRFIIAQFDLWRAPLNRGIQSIYGRERSAVNLRPLQCGGGAGRRGSPCSPQGLQPEILGLFDPEVRPRHRVANSIHHGGPSSRQTPLVPDWGIGHGQKLVTWPGLAMRWLTSEVTWQCCYKLGPAWINLQLFQWKDLAKALLPGQHPHHLSNPVGAARKARPKAKQRVASNGWQRLLWMDRKSSYACDIRTAHVHSMIANFTMVAPIRKQMDLHAAWAIQRCNMHPHLTDSMVWPRLQ